ncbi:MAG: hypothetical protein ACYDBH_12250 [Acidobacteriaceae bacterium]
MTAHKYLARLNPMLEIDAQEAHDLADALVEMELVFQVKPHPKVTAIFNLALVSGAVYGPRILLMRAMKAQQDAAQNPPAHAGNGSLGAAPPAADAATKTH